MTRAVLRAMAWIREHSAEEILARVPLRRGDPATELAAIRLAKPMYSVDGRINKESAEAVRAVIGLKVDVSKHVCEPELVLRRLFGRALLAILRHVFRRRLVPDVE